MMKRVSIPLLFLLWAGIAWANQPLYVSDILSNPYRYYNVTVEIEGTIAKVTPGTNRPSGSYILTDDLDGQIEVRTQELPTVGLRFVVKGIVSQDAANSLPYLREQERHPPGFLSGVDPTVVVLVAASVIFLLLVVILLMIVFRRPRVVEAPQLDVVTQNAPAPQGTSPRTVSPPTGRVPTTRYEEPRHQPTVAYLEGIQASLTIVDGPADLNKVYPITKRESIIGRDGDVKLSNAHLTVSNEHVRLTFVGDGQFTLTHLSLTNITHVNGQDVTESCPLESGDEIQLGSTKLRFEVQS